MKLELEQRSPAWHEARKGRITASVAAACLGLNSWVSRQKALRLILGTELQDDTRNYQWGREFEAQAISAYEDDLGVIVLPGGFWVHDDLDWLAASPDGLVGDDGLVEVKCPSVLPDGIPEKYVPQIIVQLAVTGRQWCDFFAWVGSEQARFRYRRDLEQERHVVSALAAFREQYVLTGIVPPRKRRGEQGFRLLERESET